MTLILSNNDIRRSLNVKECLNVMEETYRELASSRAVNRPTSQSYLPHFMPQSTYNFKSVDGGVRKNPAYSHSASPQPSTKNSILTTPFASKNCRWRKESLSDSFSFSAETGELLAIMPDGFIQQTRVAVTSALGVKNAGTQSRKSSL